MTTAAGDRRFEWTPGLRLRPLPELGQLLVFTPERPKLHWLNTAAWLLFTLAENASDEEILAGYAGVAGGAPGSPGTASEEVRAGLDDLERAGIIRPVNHHLIPSDTPSDTPTNERGIPDEQQNKQQTPCTPDPEDARRPEGPGDAVCDDRLQQGASVVPGVHRSRMSD
jgi:hypothetical protein